MLVIAGISAFFLFILYVAGFRGKAIDQDYVNLNIFLFTTILFIFKTLEIPRCFLNIIGHLTAGICLLCLIKYIVIPDVTGGIPGIFTGYSWSVGYVSLIAAVLASEQLTRERDKARLMISVSELITAVLVIELNNITLVTYLFAFSLFLNLIRCRLGLMTIKRYLMILFGFLFLTSNMSLITGYTKILMMKVTGYDLDVSILLDLILSICGVVIFERLDRIEELQKQTDQDIIQTDAEIRTELMALVSNIRIMGTVLICALLVSAVMGETVSGENSGVLSAAWDKMVFYLRGWTLWNKGRYSLISVANEHYGWLGVWCVIMLIIAACIRIYNLWHRTEGENQPGLVLASALLIMTTVNAPLPRVELIDICILAFVLKKNPVHLQINKMSKTTIAALAIASMVLAAIFADRMTVLQNRSTYNEQTSRLSSVSGSLSDTKKALSEANNNLTDTRKSLESKEKDLKNTKDSLNSARRYNSSLQKDMTQLTIDLINEIEKSYEDHDYSVAISEKSTALYVYSESMYQGSMYVTNNNGDRLTMSISGLDQKGDRVYIIVNANAGGEEWLRIKMNAKAKTALTQMGYVGLRLNNKYKSW